MPYVAGTEWYYYRDDQTAAITGFRIHLPRECHIQNRGCFISWNRGCFIFHERWPSEKSYKACDGASCYPWRRRRKWTWSWRRWPRRWWRRLRRGWNLCGGASVWCDRAYACSSMHAKQWCSPRETFKIYHPLIISSLFTGVNVCVLSNGVLLGRQ